MVPVNTRKLQLSLVDHLAMLCLLFNKVCFLLCFSQKSHRRGGGGVSSPADETDTHACTRSEIDRHIIDRPRVFIFSFPLCICLTRCVCRYWSIVSATHRITGTCGEIVTNQVCSGTQLTLAGFAFYWQNSSWFGTQLRLAEWRLFIFISRESKWGTLKSAGNPRCAVPAESHSICTDRRRPGPAAALQVSPTSDTCQSVAILMNRPHCFLVVERFVHKFLNLFWLH